MSTALSLPDGEIYMNELGAGSGGYWSGGGWLYHGLYGDGATISVDLALPYSTETVRGKQRA